MYDFVTATRTSSFGATNEETLAAADPTSADYSMPYIYDRFSWDHCEEDFDGMLKDKLRQKRQQARNHIDWLHRFIASILMTVLSNFVLIKLFV